MPTISEILDQFASDLDSKRKSNPVISEQAAAIQSDIANLARVLGTIFGVQDLYRNVKGIKPKSPHRHQP